MVGVKEIALLLNISNLTVHKITNE